MSHEQHEAPWKHYKGPYDDDPPPPLEPDPSPEDRVRTLEAEVAAYREAAIEALHDGREWATREAVAESLDRTVRRVKEGVKP